MDPVFVPFNLRRFVDGILATVIPLAHEKGLAIGSSFDPQTPEIVIGDRDRLQQFLVLLLDRAIMFTDAGNLTIAVASQALSALRHELTFRIQATSPDCDSGSLERLPQPVAEGDSAVAPTLASVLLNLGSAQAFVQGDGVPGGAHPGDDPSLAMRRRLSALPGGTLGLERTVGQEAALVLSIPVEQPPADVHFHLPPSASILQARRALIVDELVGSRQVLSLQLKAWGMLPEATASGDEALERVRQGVPTDVVLIAVRSADNGVAQLVAALRALRTPADLPVVVSVTRRGAADGFLRSAAGNVQALLIGPLKLSRLYAVLVSLLAPSGAWLDADRALGREPPAESREPSSADSEGALGPGPALDVDRLEQIREQLSRFGRSAFPTLLSTYLEDTPGLVAEMSRAVDHGEGAQLVHLAHKLKSSSAMLAATRLSQLCIQLEHAGERASPAEQRDRVDQIVAEYARVEAALRALVAESEG